MKKLQVTSGNYFLHYSFLNEISKTWLTKGGVCNCAILLMKLFFTPGITTHVMSDDRTMEEMSISKKRIGFIPMIYDLIKIESLHNKKNLDNNTYSFEVAPVKGITTLPTFMLVSLTEKAKVIKFAKEKEYRSLIIRSEADFDLS